jgi:hypothetical protein
VHWVAVPKALRARRVNRATQGADVRERVQMRAFEETMLALGPTEVAVQLLDTATGPQHLRLVSPRGLFRLMIRSKSTGVKKFYEWVEKMVKDTRHERQARRKAVFALPAAAELVRDFALRNILVPLANHDGWKHHKRHSLAIITGPRGRGAELRRAPEVNVLTMDSHLPHKPNLVCVKGYCTFEVPLRHVDAVLWDPARRHQWDALCAEMTVLQGGGGRAQPLESDPNTLLTQSLYRCDQTS